jgi:hypothetical protein
MTDTIVIDWDSARECGVVIRIAFVLAAMIFLQVASAFQELTVCQDEHVFIIVLQSITFWPLVIYPFTLPEGNRMRKFLRHAMLHKAFLCLPFLQLVSAVASSRFQSCALVFCATLPTTAVLLLAWSFHSFASIKAVEAPKSVDTPTGATV